MLHSDSGRFRWLPFVVAAAGRELRQRYARWPLGWLWLLLPPAVFIAIHTPHD